jgi:hypothetical protein
MPDIANATPRAKRGRGRPRGSLNKPKAHERDDPDDVLGWRPRTWARLTGTSVSTTWRRIRAGELKTVQYGPNCVLIPRSEARRLGLL